ncbi:unnamed protein product [Phyllotreta striolata]|uniref:Sorbitol dehydrogenase n=1 Tax=Phyllotreta striolata TaxID=444603 RepID=A0A9N9XHC1_PHYSR|nr:unnamed protein product [Phyllotreta striolata]
MNLAQIAEILEGSAERYAGAGGVGADRMGLLHNLTAILEKPNVIKLEQRPIPKPNCTQVLLKMEVVGICGSDIHYWLEGRCGPFVLEAPMVMGHEASGVVVECGSKVKDLKVGDRVTIEPGYGCRRCTYCKTGKYNICPEMAFCATPPIDGNLCRYFVMEADFCYKLPCNMSLEEGTLMEPLAVGVHGCKLAKITLGSVVFVQGSGPIGLSVLSAARAYGAAAVLVTDIADYRLEYAKKLGAFETLNTEGMDENQIAEKVKSILGCEPHATFECAGNLTCARLGLLCTRAGGTVVLLGMGGLEMSLPFGAALVKEITMIGSFRYNNDYPEAIEMVRTGKVSVKELVTHRFKIEDTEAAYCTFKNRSGNPIKIMIYCNEDWDGKTPR